MIRVVVGSRLEEKGARLQQLAVAVGPSVVRVQELAELVTTCWGSAWGLSDR